MRNCGHGIKYGIKPFLRGLTVCEPIIIIFYRKELVGIHIDLQCGQRYSVYVSLLRHYLNNPAHYILIVVQYPFDQFSAERFFVKFYFFWFIVQYYSSFLVYRNSNTYKIIVKINQKKHIERLSLFSRTEIGLIAVVASFL